MPSIINATTTNGLVTSADNSGSLQLQTNNGTTAVTIDTSQNVGVGTSTGGAKLQVSVGTTNISGSAWNNSNFVVGGSSSTSGGFGVSYNDTTGAIIASLLPATAWKDLTTYSNQTIFCTNGVNERMRIDSSGNVLVNLTSAVGSGKFVASNNTGYCATMNSVGNNADYIQFWNGSQVGSINRVGGSNVNYNTSSDYRLKHDVTPMTGALERVALLKPCTYKWNVDGSDGEGFIAHELAEVCPQAVSGEKDAVNEDGSIKPQGIDTSNLVAMLTAAIQEQQVIINDIKAELDSVKAELAVMKGTE